MSGEVREQTDLATWLLACLAEDEEVIRRNLGEKGLGDSGSFPDYQTYSDSDTEAANDYLDRFPPPRLLAECDTKRRIIAEHSVTTKAPIRCRACGACPDCAWDEHPDDWPCETLRLMALPYSDRDGYRAKWAPDGR